MLIGVVSVVADSFPTRVGVTQAGGKVYIVPLACPGERVRRITLGNADGLEIWSASGDSAMPERIELGVAPEGMVTTRPMTRVPPPTSDLWVMVATSELNDPYRLHFRIADVPKAPSVLDASGRTHESSEAFRRSEGRDSPCGDPHDERGLTRWILTLVVSGALVIAAGVAVLTLLPRSPRRFVHPPAPTEPGAEQREQQIR